MNSPMRPDIYRLLVLCKAFGFVPFQITDGSRISFSWKSKQMFFFCLVILIGIANVTYIFYVFIKTILDLGFSQSLVWFPWVTGFSMPLLVQIIMLWRRQELIEFLNRCTDLWAVYRQDPQYCINKTMWCIHGVYLLACMFTILSIGYLNLHQPSTAIFTSALFCSANTNNNNNNNSSSSSSNINHNICPVTATVLSVIQHSMWLFYQFLGFLIMDVLPMSIAISMARSFSIKNECLAKRNRLRALIPLAKVVPKLDNLDLEEETPEQCAQAQITIIRQTMAEHLRIQRCLATFSPTFSPFILFSITNLFAICVVLFYSVFKFGIADVSQFIVYFGNGAQILLRGTMVLHCFGNVRERANDTRDLLHLEVGLLEELRKYDSSILMEVQVFTARLDNVVISAGPYFSCTHSFLMSFYGLLATYIIVLVQTPMP